ncbi:hypothetical protein [Actinomadura harenae]|uniref:Uncharacterized protein n=1 Tax=Actinomadura harenae TaxID=2483351 RepID=A0A3M2M022_9ACTN|nr:hypothetical protein [Actinomadura harenae]RMI43059.1 hypothetical protein EBO15_17650 [Actinomadura harenae]
MDDLVMLVRLEPMPADADGSVSVRVHSPLGHVTARLEGDLEEADARHYVEWGVDEDVLWGRNVVPAAIAEPGVWADGGRIVLRGRLHLTEDGAATLEMGDAQILLDLGNTPPSGIDRTWVELGVAADSVSVWPYRL